MRLLVLDADGVMTDGRLFYGASSTPPPPVWAHLPADRQKQLHELLGQLLARLGIKDAQCACIGDDEPDVPMLRRVGLAVAVADAHPTARAVAHRRTRLAGGAGAVREVCDWLLAARAAPKS